MTLEMILIDLLIDYNQLTTASSEERTKKTTELLNKTKKAILSLLEYGNV